MTKTDKSCAHVMHMARHLNLETIKKKQFNRAPKMHGREEWGIQVGRVGGGSLNRLQHPDGTKCK